MIQVRKVQPKDLDYILTNVEALNFDKVLMLKNLENMMIIVDNNEICGLGFYINIENQCILNWIHIKQEHRRKQLGTMLVKTMLNSAEHQGALQAFLQGECEDFAEFLGFQNIIEDEEIKDITKLYDQLYQSRILHKLYKVSLIDYFKPCNSAKQCK
jgi:N-acetylglutamate synthase-like GNAT family acetyltransferase